MQNIGDITSKSSIMLETMISTAEGSPIVLDKPVSAVISALQGDSVLEVDNVKLELMDDKITHKYMYTPNLLRDGDYKITYQFSYNNKEYKKEEQFTFIESLLPRVQTLTKEEVTQTESYGDNLSDDYLPAFQEDSELKVNGNKIEITPTEDIDKNHYYIVAVTDQVASIDGDKITEGKEIHFTSEYSPLYATPLEVRSLLKGIYKYFKLSDVYVAIRDAGQKAHQLLRIEPNASSRGFSLIDSKDENYFPAIKYSSHEAAYQLLNQLMIYMIYPDDDSNGLDDESSTSVISGGFTLGDFSVSGESGGTTSQGSANELPEIKTIKRIADALSVDLKYWQDALMGLNARGYAKATYATSRGGVQAPESRDI